MIVERMATRNDGELEVRTDGVLRLVRALCSGTFASQSGHHHYYVI